MIIHEVAQGSPEWFKIRSGIPTSSNFGSLVSGTGKPSESLKKYAHTLATEAYLKNLGKAIDDEWAGNKYTERGLILEAETRADYEMTNQISIQQVGFVTDDLMRWGSSTDGFVGDDGIVEFKNLIATRFTSLMVYMARNCWKTPPEYIPQLQGELFVTERKWVDIVFYHPDFEPIVRRHFPDIEFHKTLKEQLVACISERKTILKLFDKFESM